jgi:recombination protein RecT
MEVATTDLNKQLATAAQAAEKGEALDQRGAPTSVIGFLSDSRTLKQVSRLLGSEDMADRWLRIGLTEVRRIDKLAECSLESFAGALMQCAMLKLEPGPPLGLAWILPFKNRVKVRGRWETRMDAQFQLGYPGIIQLAHRSAELAQIAAREVCENDEFDFDYLTGEKHHKPPKRGDRGDVYGYYCFARYANGGEHFLYMTKEQVEAHAQRFSQAYRADQSRISDGEKGISPWTTDFDAMARKTTIKQSRPFLPASAEFIQAAAADDRVVRFQADKLVLDDDDFELSLAPARVEELPEMSGPTDPATGEVTPKAKNGEGAQEPKTQEPKTQEPKTEEPKAEELKLDG